MYKGSLTRVDLLDDDIIEQRDVKLLILIM